MVLKANPRMQEPNYESITNLVELFLFSSEIAFSDIEGKLLCQ